MGENVTGRKYDAYCLTNPAGILLVTYLLGYLK